MTAPIAPRSCRWIPWLILATLALPCVPGADKEPRTLLPSVDQIIARLEDADNARSAALLSYSATRSYLLLNERFKKRAGMTVQVSYTQPGRKTFEVLSQDGSGVLCDRVIKRVMKGEEEGSQRENRQLSRISPVNYRLRVLGTDELRGRECFVLELEPVSKSPFLIKGRAWIDSDDYAIARVEGLLAKKPSIWVGSPKITQDYHKQGVFWLPVSSSSITDAPIFGRTSLGIQTSGYNLRTAGDPTKASR